MAKRRRGRGVQARRPEKNSTPVLDATAEPEDSGGLQTRIESTVVGRAVIAGMIVFLLVAIAVSNLPPDSEASHVFYPRFRPFLNATGLQQKWHMFGPEPRRQTKWFEARLTYADGTTVQWHQPRGAEPFISTYRGYRWQKISKSVMVQSHLWRPAATWIARNHQRDGEWPTSVVLIKRQYLFPGIDSSARPTWQEEQFYAARFTPDGEQVMGR